MFSSSLLFLQHHHTALPRAPTPACSCIWLNVFIRNVGEILELFKHVSWFRKHSGHSSLSVFPTHRHRLTLIWVRERKYHSGILISCMNATTWMFHIFHCSRCYRINLRVRETSESVGIRVRLCGLLSGDILVKNKTFAAYLFKSIMVPVWAAGNIVGFLVTYRLIWIRC